MDYFAPDKIIQPKAGDVIISEPYLPDKNFDRSVVLLCEHNNEGTFGLVLNQPTGHPFNEVIKDSGTFDAEIHVGGPVQQDTLHFIHRAPDLIDHVMKVNDELFYGGDQDKLMSLIDTFQIRKEDFRFFVGYSGWSPGQLQDELNAKSWIVCQDVTTEEVFDVSPDELWKYLLTKKGGKYRAIANYPVDPRMN